MFFILKLDKWGFCHLFVSAVVPYLTFGVDRLCTYPALGPYHFGPMRHPDEVTDHISLLLLVVLANHIKGLCWTLLSSSGPSRYDPKMESLIMLLCIGCCVCVAVDRRVHGCEWGWKGTDEAVEPACYASQVSAFRPGFWFWLASWVRC